MKKCSPVLCIIGLTCLICMIFIVSVYYASMCDSGFKVGQQVRHKFLNISGIVLNEGTKMSKYPGICVVDIMDENDEIHTIPSTSLNGN